jgi:Zn-dependent M28 family amino/carboxypeptidase
MLYRVVSLLVVAVLTASCAQINTSLLASDALLGRNNLSPESIQVQDYLIAQLSGAGATGLNVAGVGDNAYKQSFALGTNILALIPGTDLADEYVMVGAHYDHIAFCPQTIAGDSICNGATDNAAGVAAVLDIGLHLAFPENRPRRSVILAFWDAEEDGLRGSAHYVANPLVPLADTVGYINFDILGSNLLPSLRGFSIAVGAESGGAGLVAGVDAASATESLDVRQFSEVFGQGRSDHANLIAAGVPSVFFTDSTGPCYHSGRPIGQWSADADPGWRCPPCHLQ